MKKRKRRKFKKSEILKLILISIVAAALTFSFLWFTEGFADTGPDEDLYEAVEEVSLWRQLGANFISNWFTLLLLVIVGSAYLIVKAYKRWKVDQ